MSEPISTGRVAAVLARAFSGPGRCTETRLAVAAEILAGALQGRGAEEMTLAELYWALENQARGGQVLEEVLSGLRPAAQEQPAVSLADYARDIGLTD